jgi:hypothetical protein
MGIVALARPGRDRRDRRLVETHRRPRAGSRKVFEGPEKLIGQIGLAAILSYFTFRHGAANPVAHELYLPFIKHRSDAVARDVPPPRRRHAHGFSNA